MAKSDGELILAGDMLAVIAGELQRSPELASEHSRRTYLGALQDFEAFRAGRNLTKTLVGAYAAHLRDQGLAPATINHKLSAVRWWARRLADLALEAPELTPARRREVAARATAAAGVGNVKGESEQRGRHVAEGEIRALLQAAADEGPPIGTRDAALIAVAAATGLRRAEIAALERGDVAEIEGGEGLELTIRRAKGGKTRTVAVYNGARDWLRDWLALRGDREGRLFLAVRKGGLILGHGLGTKSMEERLLKHAATAGVSNVGWHDFRRTLAGNLLDEGADLATVQRILGHSSPVTTSAYDRRPEETRRKALRSLHVPYWKR